MTRAKVAAVRLGAVTAVWLLASGCVYYNGVYNAEKAAKRGDNKLRRNEDDAAREDFRISATHAETVLARAPKSSWYPRALYLAGRGLALAGECTQAVPRLDSLLAIRALPPEDRARATIALASCETRQPDQTVARARIDSLLVTLPEGETRRQARLWGARAALAQGDLAAVDRYLGSLDAGLLPWEVVNAALGSRDYARAESVVVSRGALGDFRSEVVRTVTDLASAAMFPQAERVVKAYDNPRVRESNRARLHYTIGEQFVRAGRDTLARRSLQLADGLVGKDSLLRREVRARLLLLDLRRADSMAVADSMLARVDSSVWVTPFGRTIGEHLLLVRLLSGRDDPSGASAYLAGEVVRDSLRTPLLAQSVFTSFARTRSTSVFAPWAWYAASVLRPDSAERWQQRIRTEFPASSVAARLRGDDPSTAEDYQSASGLLKLRWGEALRVWADSVRKLRARAAPRAP